MKVSFLYFLQIWFMPKELITLFFKKRKIFWRSPKIKSFYASEIIHLFYRTSVCQSGKQIDILPIEKQKRQKGKRLFYGPKEGWSFFYDNEQFCGKLLDFQQTEQIQRTDWRGKHG